MTTGAPHRRATIHDVARAAGVSVATVSKAVNGRYGVAQDTVDRVLQAVERLGYESSLGASSMRSQRTGVIGVLVAGFEPFSAEILKGVSTALHEGPYDLLAYSGARLSRASGWERRSLQRLSGTLIDAAILVTPSIVDLTAQVPIVAVDPHTGRADVPTVESDSLRGAHEAVAYLISLGHRRIGLVGGRPDLRSAQARAEGYRRALAAAGIPYDPTLVRVGNYQLESARGAARELLSMPQRPTAVFGSNDLSAIATIEVATAMGISVPGQLSVIGFDDVPEAARLSPALSTVRQPMRRLGAAAARMVLAMLRGETVEDSHVLLATRLVPRQTTAPPSVAQS